MDTQPLRTTRRRHLVTIEALSKQTGLSTKTIVDIELGRQKPQLRTIDKISRALGVDPLSVDEFKQAIEDPELGKDLAAQSQKARAASDNVSPVRGR